MKEAYNNESGYLVTEACLRTRQVSILGHPSLDNLSPLETTVFLFSRNPPADQWTTRIGGVPAWYADSPWPACENCDEPLAFAAQIDFRGSQFTRIVPGDTLVFHYCFSCCPWFPDQPGFSLTWQSQSSSEMLSEPVIPDDLEENELGPCYGMPLKAIDYKHDQNSDTLGLFTLLGTKIGGYPPDIQSAVPPRDSNGNEMIFLASLGSLDASDVPRIHGTPPVGDLVWGDEGCISFWGSVKTNEFETLWGLSSF